MTTEQKDWMYDSTKRSNESIVKEIKRFYGLDLKPGDLITSYKKGIYQFLGVKDRFYKDLPLEPLVEYKQLYTANGKPRVSKESSWCSSYYVTKLEFYHNSRLKELQEEIDFLTNLYNAENERLNS